MLVRRMYSWRSYDFEASRCGALGGNEISIQACGPQGVFGTLSLQLDSPQGLRADELYRLEIESFRTRGATVCEMTGRGRSRIRFS